MIMRSLHAMGISQLPPLKDPLASFLIPISATKTTPPPSPHLLECLHQTRGEREVRVWWGLGESARLSFHLQSVVDPCGWVGVNGEIIRCLFHVGADEFVVPAAENDDLGGSGVQGDGVE